MGAIPEMIAAVWAQAMPGREAAAVNELMRAIQKLASSRDAAVTVKWARLRRPNSISLNSLMEGLPSALGQNAPRGFFTPTPVR